MHDLRNGDLGRVLLVDDEPAICSVFAESLSEAGYLVETAASGNEALERLASPDYDLVLSDIAMPGMDGLELMRAVRERDLDLPVVIMTGNPTLVSAVHAIEFGALRYLTKPVHEPELLAAVDHGIRLGRLARLKREALAELGGPAWRPTDRAGLEVRLQSSLATLYMAYQPIVGAADAALYGYEALVRSRDGFPNPGLLFEGAERLGRVAALGSAIRHSVAGQIESAPAAPVFFVNLHASELVDEALYSPREPLSHHAGRVVLEITERSALDSIDDLAGRARRLRDLGYRIAVDDLGAGYARLASLAAREPEVVNLALALVRGVDASPTRQRLIASMTAVCHELGARVVAEGVETAAVRDALRDLGCDLLQGYFFGRPAPLGA